MNDITLQILEQMAAGTIPDTIPDSAENADTLRRLAQYFTAIQHFTLALSDGDLSQSLQGVTGAVAGGLKSLQSGLRHLTWQAKQIATGDFSQHVDFLGDLSVAINTMVKDLGDAASAREEMNVCLQRDMEELRRLTEELGESEKRFRLIAENAKVVIWTFNIRLQRFTYISPFIENLRGLSVQEAMEEPLSDAFTAESLLLVQEKLLGKRTLPAEYGLSNTPLDIIEVEQICRDKTTISVEMVISAIADHAGNIREFVGISRDVTERKRAEEERLTLARQREGVNLLQRALLKPVPLEAKLVNITDGVVKYFNADFCRIWLIRAGDLCERGCMHAAVKEGRHVCRQRDKCLHLLASSGRYTHLDGQVHRRVPFGCYKIGLIASGKAPKLFTNDVVNDPRIHDHAWARTLGLVSFAGYQRRVPEGEPIGVLALFAKHPLLAAEDSMLEGLSSAVALAIQQAAAEHALRENTIFLNTILNSLPLPVFYKDTNCRFIGFNKAYEEFIGKTHAQLLGKSIFDVAPPKLAEYYHARDLELLRDRGTQVYEARVRSGNGRMRDVVFYKATFADGSGRTLGLIGTILDITERKRAEKELEFSNVILSTQQETTIDGILVIDGKNAIISSNRRFADIWGISHILIETGNNVAVLRSIAKQIADKEGFLTIIRHLYEHKEEISQDEIVLTDGRVIDHYSAPMLGAERNYLGRVWYFRDITERKHMEESQRASRQLLKDIFDFLPDATMVLDNDKHVIAWNRAIEEMTGIPKAEMLGKGDYATSIPFYGVRSSHLLDLLDIDDKELEAKYRYVVRNGNRLHAEVYAPALFDGHGAWLWAFGAPLYNAQGERIGAIESVRDITAQKEAQLALKESRQRLMDIIEFLPDATFIIDKEGTVIAWNRAMVALSGIKAQEMLGKRDYEYALPFYGERRPALIDFALHPDLEPEKSDASFRREGDILIGESFVPCLRSSKAYLSATASVLRDSSGEIVAAIACIRDETKRREIEDALRASQNQLALAMGLARLVKWEFDVATCMFTFDDQFYALYGTSIEKEGGSQMSGDTYIREFVHPDDARSVSEIIRETLSSKESNRSVEAEHRIIRRDGELRDIVVKFITIRDDSGNTIRAYGANQDITEHKRLERLLHLQAHTDQMTGIYNRGHFLELLDNEIKRASRYDRSLCVLMLDLDHFKSVNDSRGHAAGDEAIRTFIRVLRSSGLRRSDFLGRIGGEEFMVALPETDVQSAADVAERVRSQLALTPVNYASETFSITVSIGVCDYRGGDSQETLLQRADLAMYQAKQAGRNQVFLIDRPYKPGT
jgi:diguanylate cyclase (GGDEF)-like protein/PAS domain S-box-containing protein